MKKLFRSLFIALILLIIISSTAFAAKNPPITWDYFVGECEHRVGWEATQGRWLNGDASKGTFRLDGSNSWEIRDYCNDDVVIDQGAAEFMVLMKVLNGNINVYHQHSISFDGTNLIKNNYGVVNGDIKVMQLWQDGVKIWTQH